ncbi:MAG: hypothetical protein BM556_02190 [Bacteriovorax sp. MedPE-SWde]|nr:MAG: hypothetical protein BM556_02190 [Bacteriovorax sp. MedPE-SWde]
MKILNQKSSKNLKKSGSNISSPELPQSLFNQKKEKQFKKKFYLRFIICLITTNILTYQITYQKPEKQQALTFLNQELTGFKVIKLKLINNIPLEEGGTSATILTRDNTVLSKKVTILKEIKDNDRDYDSKAFSYLVQVPESEIKSYIHAKDLVLHAYPIIQDIEERGVPHEVTF